MKLPHPFFKLNTFTVFFILFFCAHSFGLPSSKSTPPKELFFTLYGITIFHELPLEGVQLELTKDGVTLSVIKTDKYGKFKFKIPVSTENENNEYLVLISKEGMITKRLSVNTYLPQLEVNQGNMKFACNMTIVMAELKQKDILLANPSGKLKWNDSEKQFSFDQQYGKIAQKEEELFIKSPEKYAEYIDNQKQKTENVETNSIKEKIDQEKDKLNTDVSLKEKIVKVNIESKENRMTNMDEAAAMDLQLKKEENSSFGSSGKDAEIIEILRELKEIKKETDPKLNRELEKEKELRVNKDIKYNGDNRFSAVLKAAEEKEKGTKKDKPQKKKLQETNKK